MLNTPYPHSTLYLAELASHATGQGREYFQRHVTANGGIQGFNFVILPLLVAIRGSLMKAYPEIAEFAESLSERNLKKIFRSREETARLIEEIEDKFGKTITVQPLDIPKDLLDKVVTKLQQQYVLEVTIPQTCRL